MTVKEIKDRLEKVEKAIFYETMADFMDWDKYYKLRDEERELKLKLKEMGE